MRKKTNVVSVGALKIGGDNDILIQSMTNTKTQNISATVKQINALAAAGCEIIRVAVPDIEAANALKEIKSMISIPLVADIHFDHRLALLALENGVDKLRINPGNIGNISKIKEVVTAAKEKNVPIRIGVNSGSVEKDLLEKHGGATDHALVESAMRHVHILEGLNFQDIIVSIKASSVRSSISCYTQISEIIPYPLHVGITETGTTYAGTIKSAAGIGAILSSGIGDTIRVSLTADPIEEIKCAKEILKALELRDFGIKFISCPTCGRTEINLIKIAEEVEMLCKDIDKTIKVAVMGCAVNGPGEAREADIGIAGGNGEGLIFKKGEIFEKAPEHRLVSRLVEIIKEI